MSITIKAKLFGALRDGNGADVAIADVRANITDGLSIIGYSDSVTLSGQWVEFIPSGTYSRNLLYQVQLVKKVGGEVLTDDDPVWIESSSGVFIARDFNAIAAFDRERLLAQLVGSTITSSSPVASTGTIANIVRADDYKSASQRSFIWYVAVPSFSQTGSRCYFGGSAQHKGKWLVEGTITPVTIDSVPKWKLEFELLKSDTVNCKPGCYDWSVELRGPAPEQITKTIGKTELIEAYTR